MTKPEILLVDLDGTVANCEHRKKYIDDVIRVGDTVYYRNIRNARENPGKVVHIWQNDQKTKSFYDIKFARPIHLVTNQLAEACTEFDSLRKCKSYKRFFESCKDDSPIQTTIDIVGTLSWHYPIIFCSGRPDDYRELTKEWLRGVKPVMGWYTMPNVEYLFMRPSGDMRQDYIVKEELYRKHIEPYYTVKAVFDDRKQVVDMWRRLGIQCYAVADGLF